MLRRCLLLLLLFGMAIGGHAQTLFRGMTEQEVIETVGTPVSEMGRSSKKKFIYAEGSLEFRSGRLYSADGIAMAFMAPDGHSQFTFSTIGGWTFNGEAVATEFRFTEAPENLPPPPDTGVRKYRPGDDYQRPKAPSQPAPNVVVDGPPPVPTVTVPVPVEEQTPLSPILDPVVDHLSDMEESYEDYEDYDEDYYYEEEELSPMETMVELVVLFLGGFIITVVVLKISFENKGFPVLMPQLLLVSGAQALVSLGVNLGFEAMEMDAWYVIQLIEYLSLAGFIVLFTDVQQATTAFSIALISRIVTFFVNLALIFIFMMIFFG